MSEAGNGMYSAGLFVGVSAQQDSRIMALRHGHRDAEGLRAVFADANALRGDSPDSLQLVTNDSATRENVSAALRGLSELALQYRPEVVLVHFSCHGGPSGELALYDCEIGRVPQTSLSVAEVVTVLSSIQSSQVILSLDCCFAGAVLGMPESPNQEALGRLLGGFTGENKFVVWAAEPGQKAWEDLELAHGYLTHSMIRSLSASRSSGATSVATAQWLTSAAQAVESLATRHGHIQRAGCLVRTTSAATILVPAIGENQRLFSKDYGVLPVTENVRSLDVYGFSSGTLDAVSMRLGGNGATLNRLQRDAVSPGGVLAGQSVLVRAPTSAGKTLVGELTMLLHWPLGRKTVVLLPMRAMVHEQGDTLKRHYGGLGLRVVVSTGEAADDDDFLLSKQFDVALLTYEKFEAVLTLRPELIRDLGLIVFDEVQLIEEGSRGRVVEMLLVRAKQIQGPGRFPQVIVLCGELANLDDLQSWLGLQPIGMPDRPIPLHQGVINASGRGRLKVGGSDQTRLVDFPMDSSNRAKRAIRKDEDIRAATAVEVARDMVRQGKQVLLFCFAKWEVFRLAEWLAEDLRLTEVRLALPGPGSEETRASKQLRHTVRSGVGFHLADLDKEERREVEDAFRRRDLRVLVATSTLAMGVNLPADVVIVVGADVFQGRDKVLMSVPKFRNMAGRAGRMIPGGPAEGFAFLVAASAQEEQVYWERYIAASPPALRSGLGELPVCERTIGLLRHRSNASPVDLARDLAETFWGFAEQRGAKWMTERRRETEAALVELESRQLASQTSPGRWQLTSLGEVAAAFGLSVRSVEVVLHAIRAAVAENLKLDGVCLLLLTQMMTELDEIPVHRGRMATSAWPPCPDALSKYLPLWELMVASSGPTACDATTAYNRAHRVATLLQWRAGRSLPELESLLDVLGRGTPASGLLRSIVDRTIDMLPATAALAARLAPDQTENLRRVLTSAKAQLSVGGDADAGELFGLKLDLTRADCRNLSMIGVRAEGLSQAIIERRDEVIEVLGEARFARLVAKLGDTRYHRRAGVGDQLVFEGIGDLTGL